jgi:hypothetical protein
MAHVTAGITAQWDATALGEITEIKWTHGGGLPQSRGSTVAGTRPWSLDLGTIDISHLSAEAVGNVTQQWGRKATLAIGGTARNSLNTASIVTVNLTTKAICQTLDIGAKVNDVWRYKSTFKIVME